MAVALVITLLVVGSVVFHLVSPWWLTPLASNWGALDDALNITFMVTGAVFIAINLFLAYCLYKYRHRADSKADYDPENTTLEKWLTGLTAAGIVALLAPGLMAWADYVDPPDDAMIVEAFGHQWQWSFRFPGPDGVLGTTATKYISGDNSFGLNPDDPFGQDDILVESNELHLPLGQPLKLVLRSKDVLHNFFVPQFRAKMDMVPGMVTYMWLTPTREGTFDLLCAELCGVGHYAMRGFVIVEDQAAFDGWLGDWPSFAQVAAEGARETADAHGGGAVPDQPGAPG